MNKKNWILGGVLLGFMALAAPSLRAGTPAEAGWEKLTSLVGEWTGTADGKPVRVTYGLASSGTAILETIHDPDAVEMVTLYHRDGSSLLMTHYCSMGNQPRMRSKGLLEGKLSFVFVDATNLRSPGEHVMTGLVLSFPDPDRLVADWTSKGDGKEATTRFSLARKK